MNDAAGAVGQRGGQRQPGDRTALNFVFDQLIRQNRDPDVLLDGIDDRAGARAFPQRRDLNLGGDQQGVDDLAGTAARFS